MRALILFQPSALLTGTAVLTALARRKCVGHGLELLLGGHLLGERWPKFRGTVFRASSRAGPAMRSSACDGASSPNGDVLRSSSTFSSGEPDLPQVANRAVVDFGEVGASGFVQRRGAPPRAAA